VAPFPYGWAYARGPDPILRRVVMPEHRPGPIGEKRLKTERRLPNRVEDPSPFSLPDLRRTGYSTVHYEAAASLFALSYATSLRSGASLFAISARHRITPRSSPSDFSCDPICQAAIALRTFHAVSGASTRTENWDSQWTDALVVSVIKPLRPGMTTV
jgi:hypothetical protein